MTTNITQQVLQLALMLAIVFAAGNYYRRRFPADLKHATFWPRLLAGVVDACVFWPVGLVFSNLMARGYPLAVMIVLMPLPSVIWWLYNIGLHARGGQTLGKMACRVRVVDAATGNPITAGQAARREALPGVVSLLCLGYAAYLLRVMAAADASEVSPDESISQVIRLVVVVAVLPVAWCFLELLTMLVNPRHRALPDLLAGTLVIRTNTE